MPLMRRATAVTVEIKDGGTSLIRITDNGCGIDSCTDSDWHFYRHSTSKIRTSRRSWLRISSLGFRGEALSSIAAVAQVELITKTAGAVYRQPVSDRGAEKRFLWKRSVHRMGRHFW